MQRRFAIIAVVSAILLGARTPAADLVIDHVNVVDVRNGAVARNRALVIANGRIARITAGGTVRGTKMVDGRGAYVVPGFNDMHAHNLNTASPATSLPLMLTSGVTGFRQMAPADPPTTASLLSPTTPALLARPGRLLAGPALATPAAVAAEIDRQKTGGVDFIKIIDVPAPTFLAAINRARADGLPIAGHLPPTVDPRDAIRAGMSSIEHMGPTISLLLACSRDEAAIRALLLSLPLRGGVDFDAEPGKVQRLLANPSLLTPPQGFQLIRRVLATYDDAKCRTFARVLAKSGTWVVPTLTRLEAMNLGNAPELRDNPDLKYVPPKSRQLWREVGQDFDSKLSPEQHRTLADLFAAQVRLAGLFDRAGVKMMAGTDFGGQWLVPGRSLHREFDLLARAGISPLHILQMTTFAPGRFLGRETRMGAVSPGHDADLVLLAANPVTDVANLHRVVGVVRAGHYLSRVELDAIDRDVAASLADR